MIAVTCDNPMQEPPAQRGSVDGVVGGVTTSTAPLQDLTSVLGNSGLGQHDEGHRVQGHEAVCSRSSTDVPLTGPAGVRLVRQPLPNYEPPLTSEPFKE